MWWECHVTALCNAQVNAPSLASSSRLRSRRSYSPLHAVHRARGRAAGGARPAARPAPAACARSRHRSRTIAAHMRPSSVHLLLYALVLGLARCSAAAPLATCRLVIIGAGTPRTGSTHEMKLARMALRVRACVAHRCDGLARWRAVTHTRTHHTR